MDRLPEDALAGVLRRLPARDLAACRCVRKEWRGVIDAPGLLAALLRELPRSLHGVFINYEGCQDSHLFARRQTSAAARHPVDGTLAFMPNDDWTRSVVDHCNGLLLSENGDCLLHVCNPATQRWGRLTWPRRRYAAAYLVFDPAVSLHYEVFLLPQLEKFCRMAPVRYKMEVFSSRSGWCQEREFVREGNSVVTLADVVMERKDGIGP